MEQIYKFKEYTLVERVDLEIEAKRQQHNSRKVQKGEIRKDRKKQRKSCRSETRYSNKNKKCIEERRKHNNKKNGNKRKCKMHG